MKREEIIAKWAGMTARERDAWVAEVVLGHSVGRERRLNGEIFIVDADAPHGFQRAVPRYTTDISAAWTVLDSVRLNYYVQLDDKESGKWTFSIRYGKWKATALSAPEAICLASIIAELEVPANESA